MEVSFNFEKKCWASGCRNGRIWSGCSCGGCTPDWEELPICDVCGGTGKVPSDLGKELIEFIEKHFDLKRKE